MAENDILRYKDRTIIGPAGSAPSRPFSDPTGNPVLPGDPFPAPNLTKVVPIPQPQAAQVVPSHGQPQPGGRFNMGPVGIGPKVDAKTPSPLLTNLGEGGSRVEYANADQRAAYSKPDTATINRLMASTPTAQEYADKVLGKQSMVTPGTKGYYDMTGISPVWGKDGKISYSAPGGRTVSGEELPKSIPYAAPQPGQAPAWQAQAAQAQEQSRQRSSIEERILNATKMAVDALARKQEYRTVRAPNGQTFEMPVKDTVDKVDPNRLFTSMYDAERQAETSSQRLSYDREADLRRESGMDRRAELGAETSRYATDRGAESRESLAEMRAAAKPKGAKAKHNINQLLKAEQSLTEQFEMAKASGDRNAAMTIAQRIAKIRAAFDKSFDDDTGE